MRYSKNQLVKMVIKETDEDTTTAAAISIVAEDCGIDEWRVQAAYDCICGVYSEYQ